MGWGLASWIRLLAAAETRSAVLSLAVAAVSLTLLGEGLPMLALVGGRGPSDVGLVGASYMALVGAGISAFAIGRDWPPLSERLQSDSDVERPGPPPIHRSLAKPPWLHDRRRPD